MTFNIQHGKGMDGKIDLQRIAAEISKAEVDFAALQEVDRYQIRSCFRDQVFTLANELGMYSCYSPSINLGFSQYGNAILSRKPIEFQTKYYMNGGLERRSILIAGIQINGEIITLINTHLGILKGEQKWQMSILRDVLKSIKSPAILMGDFNMEMSNIEMQQLSSFWHKLGLIYPHSTFHSGTEIDHIFVNWPNETAKAWVQVTDASDHYAVLADLNQFE
jgi:endonuclease/exonuclease/phosphatase family metal-dependent hydrolase